MKLRKNIVTLVLSALLSAMSIIPAFAATVVGDYSVEIYGYAEAKGGYIASSYMEAMVESITLDDDNNYVVTFAPQSYGYVSWLTTANGEEAELTDDNYLILTYSPEDVAITVIDSNANYVGEACGTLFDYTIVMKSGLLSTPTSAICITPAK